MPIANVIFGKCIFCHKLHPDSSLARYKARWVVCGFSEESDTDFDETFSLVVKPTTIPIVLSLASSKSWVIHQHDVKHTFLHTHLRESVYCQQPSSFLDSSHLDFFHLNKALYSLKQVPRA